MSIILYTYIYNDSLPEYLIVMGLHNALCFDDCFDDFGTL